MPKRRSRATRSVQSRKQSIVPRLRASGRQQLLIFVAVFALAGAAYFSVTHAESGDGVAVTAPFTWGSPTSEQWCPTFHGMDGCDNIQSQPQNFTNTFVPSQVAINSSGHVVLKMSADMTKSGAFNTGDTPNNLETFKPPFTISTQVNAPCTGGMIDNWPAVWTRGTVGTWPAEGEFDILEGLSGVPKWHYHYVDGGQDAQVGAAYTGGSGFPCGTAGTGGAQTYKLHVFTNGSGQTEADFYAHGSLQGRVAQSCASPCISIGVPVATDPQFMIYDYATGSLSGPKVGRVSFKVNSFSYSAN